ncbi:MAG: aldo/keto reductase [Deltaproteobacteria bacterium]|nr:aldo/keto reductase [Deltaproteobacteria bacterium]
MRYKLFGKSGLKVSELCLGTMTFGQEWGWGSTREESKNVFDLYVKAGGNFLDTANFYTGGSSEKYLGEFIKSERERFVLATKYTLNTNPKDPNSGGNHRKCMMQSLDASLKRLGTEYIDIYWMHAWDTMTPAEEVMRVFDDMVRAGKIMYVGISDAPAWWIAKANTIANERGWTPISGLQLEYSLIERTIEREYFQLARDQDMAVTTWGPLGGGVLTGKYNKSAKSAPAKDSRLTSGAWADATKTDRNLSIAEEVRKIADETGRTPAQIALNWVRQQQHRGNVIPLLGARTVVQLQDNLACLEFKLSDQHLARLTDVSRIAMGFPHDFLTMTREAAHGETFDAVDNHHAL